MNEKRHVEFSPPSPTSVAFAEWVESLSGRLVVVMPWPANTRVWMAVTVEP
jgi:hypothetical protein